MIDLCVVNYNTKPNLEKLLDTLHSDSTNPKNWKLYITDNGSIDGTVKWIKKHINKYLVDRLLLKKNNGYAFACNYMASKSNSDIIGFLNADVWLTSNDVQKIQKVFDENPDARIENGRWGPYIKFGKLNIKIPKDKTPESISYAEVLVLAEAAEKEPKKGGAKRFAKKK